MELQAERGDIDDAGTLATAQAALYEDEVRRTHVFMGASGGLAIVGAAATWLFDGDPFWRLLFNLGVLFLLGGYLALWWYTRDLRNYSPLKAVVVITICNLSGIAACLYFGLFSPAPMILLLPISFIGFSRSGAAAYVC